MKIQLTTTCLLALMLAETCTAGTDDVSGPLPPPEFEIALRKFELWRDSLDTLKADYTWVNPQFADPDNGLWSEAEDRPVCQSHLEWHDWWVGNNQQQMKIRSKVQKPGHHPFGTVSGWDGEFGYFAEYDQAAMYPRVLSVVDMGSNRTLQVLDQLPLFPVYFATNGWFSGAFVKTPIEYAGTKMIDGSRCVGIRHFQSSDQVIWLDLEHDGLPRLIEPEGGSVRWEWRCDEFMLSNTGRWFPKRGKFGSTGRELVEFEVQSVTMNEKIPVSRFEIPTVIDATSVRDMSKEGAKLKVATISTSFAIPTIAWWRLQCGFGILVACAAWLSWRRQQPSRADDANMPAPQSLPQWA